MDLTKLDSTYYVNITLTYWYETSRYVRRDKYKCKSVCEQVKLANVTPAEYSHGISSVAGVYKSYFPTESSFYLGLVGVVLNRLKEPILEGCKYTNKSDTSTCDQYRLHDFSIYFDITDVDGNIVYSPLDAVNPLTFLNSKSYCFIKCAGNLLNSDHSLVDGYHPVLGKYRLLKLKESQSKLSGQVSFKSLITIGLTYYAKLFSSDIAAEGRPISIYYLDTITPNTINSVVHNPDNWYLFGSIDLAYLRVEWDQSLDTNQTPFVIAAL